MFKLYTIYCLYCMSHIQHDCTFTFHIAIDQFCVGVTGTPENCKMEC